MADTNPHPENDETGRDETSREETRGDAESVTDPVNDSGNDPVNGSPNDLVNEPSSDPVNEPNGQSSVEVIAAPPRVAPPRVSRATAELPAPTTPAPKPTWWRRNGLAAAIAVAAFIVGGAIGGAIGVTAADRDGRRADGRYSAEHDDRPRGEQGPSQPDQQTQHQLERNAQQPGRGDQSGGRGKGRGGRGGQHGGDRLAPPDQQMQGGDGWGAPNIIAPDVNPGVDG